MSEATPPELTSWKEIAARLQVTVRTAQEWEKKRGLPVRRVPGQGRSRVYLRVDELEAWLDGQLVEQTGADSAHRMDAGVGRAAALGLFSGRGRAWGLAGVVTIVILAAVATAAYLLRPTAPANSLPSAKTTSSLPPATTTSSLPPAAPVDMRILPDEIVVLDEYDEEVWRRHFDGALNEQGYETKAHSFTFDDVDRDGDKDTLFILRRKDITTSNVLICYDEAGEEIWEFTPGARVETASRVFTDLYNVAEFRPFNLPDGRHAVVVIGAHHIDEPTEITVLDAADGSVISRYWHMGHIGTEPKQLAIADVNQDGSVELYLAGISNANWQATLVVLDPLTMCGAAEETDSAYQLQGFDTPSEIARILFRRSAINLATQEWNGAERVWASPEFVTVSVCESFRRDDTPAVIYDLMPDLTFGELTLNSVFPMIHEQLLEEGTISISLDEEKERLSGVDYLVVPPWLAAPPPDGH